MVRITVADRSADVVASCRLSGKGNEPFPPAVVAAISDYLSDGGSLIGFHAAWAAFRTAMPHACDSRGNGVAIGVFFHPGLSADPEELDELDLRLLDLELALGPVAVQHFMGLLANDARAARAHDHLLGRGVAEADVWRLLFRPFYFGVGIDGPIIPRDSDGKPTALGQIMLRYLRRYPSECWQYVLGSIHIASVGPLIDLVRFLQGGGSPYAELVPESAFDRLDALAHQRHRSMGQVYLGGSALQLFQAFPDRYTELLRSVVASPNPARPDDRARGLAALLEVDAHRHVDLAVAAVREALTLPRRQVWRGISLYRVALEAVYRFDRSAYRGLVAEAACIRDDRVSAAALALLAADADVETARPGIQQCVARGACPEVVARALGLLLDAGWEGRLDYALSLFAHRSAAVRERVVAWLCQEGPETLTAVEPLLRHRIPLVRLTAARCLHRLAPERAEPLLRALLGTERSREVRESLVQIVGSPEPAAEAVAAYTDAARPDRGARPGSRG